MTGFLATLATIWRLAVPYFRSEDRTAGRVLLTAVIAIELSNVGIMVMLNQWNARFYNALQDRNWDSFVHELLVFCALAAAYIVLAVYQLYLNQWLQIRWRQWMTRKYLEHWLTSGFHYRMQVLGDAADNPDQRIAEDIQIFIERTLTVGIGLLGATVSLASFVLILWTLSKAAPLTIGGEIWNVPGYLVWAALIYAAVGTLLTHLIGRPLVALNFYQQRYEADFRFNLVRVRENSEQIALLHGEPAERERLGARFAAVVGNWLAIMSRTKKLTFLTSSYAQISVIFPYIVVTPAYFAGHLQLGGLTQTAGAFNAVQTALSFFINVYRQLAEWRAVIERLTGFEAAIATAANLGVTTPAIAVVAAPAAQQVRLAALDVTLPDGKPLVSVDDAAFAPRDHVLVTGPSGSGKSTLFRAIAGIWPFGRGTVSIPAQASVMTLPQRPYLPIGPLSAAVTYPTPGPAHEPARIRELLLAVGLPALAERLDDVEHWNRMLSLGEQQRIGIARAILHAPDYLFLDEATASLDEPAEAALYRLLRERLPATTVISIGHRSTLMAFHDRHLSLKREGDHFAMREAALSAVAS